MTCIDRARNRVATPVRKVRLRRGVSLTLLGIVIVVLLICWEPMNAS